MTHLKFLFTYMKKVLWRQLVVLLIVFAYVALSLFTPLIFSYLIDNVIHGEPISSNLFVFITNCLGGIQNLHDNLWIGGLLLVGANLVLGLTIYLRGRLNSEISEITSEEIRNNLYDHLQKLPYSYHVRSQSGDLIQRCTSDVDTIRRFLAGQLAEMFYAILIAGFASYILFGIDVKLAWFSIISLPLIFGVSFFFFKVIRKSFQEVDEAEGQLTSVAQENLSGLRVVRAFNRESYEINKYDEKNHKFSDSLYACIKHMGLHWGTSDFLCMAQIGFTVLMGIYEAIAGNITIGQFSVFISYESMIIYPMRQLGRIISDMGRMNIAIDRINEIFNEPIEDLTTGLTPAIKGDIVFENVSFKYDDGTLPVLNDVSFHIKPGETVAIMGPTGSGKSSLVHLLPRLYDYTSGSIKIDSVELKEIQKKYLRHNIGIVLQEPYLYSKTIYDNIRIANPTAPRKKVDQAAEVAAIRDVISEFNQGYDTLVGEKGVTLSGGQKQRMAIARTIINDCPILIFDDSLSAVDTETDAAIRGAIKGLSGSLTTIIIAHRISSAQSADRIIILEDGKITENGSPAQLVKRNGLYKRIYRIQMDLDKGSDN